MGKIDEEEEAEESGKHDDQITPSLLQHGCGLSYHHLSLELEKRNDRQSLK
jgi:hypothetical protein